MIKKIAWEWQKLDDSTFRAKVIGGWLIKCIEGKQISTIFVSDRDFEWTIVPPFVNVPDSKIKVNPNDFKAS